MISVLYIHTAGIYGGATRSLIEMVNAFPAETVRVCALVPRGRVAQEMRHNGFDVIEVRGISQFDNTQFGHYRGLRWLILAREIYLLPFTVLGLWRAKRQFGKVDVVHINEITALLPMMLAKLFFKTPVVVHVRSMQNSVRNLRSIAIDWLLNRYANLLVAIDEDVKHSLPYTHACEVVHNGYHAPKIQGKCPSINAVFRVAMVGVLLPYKGVYDFMQAAALCRDMNIPVQFLLIGDNPQRTTGVLGHLLVKLGFSHNVKANIESYVRDNHLEEYVYLQPFTLDIESIYSSLNAVCFPSHLEAAGRPVIEAAFWNIPSIVASSKPLSDVVIEGKTGLRIDPKKPLAIAQAIQYLVEHPAECWSMGQQAGDWVRREFRIEETARRVLDIYRHLLS